MNECKNCEKKKKLNKIAYVFMIISTVLLAIFIFPMAWCIPMTISVKKKINNQKSENIVLGVCSLIFVNLIAGILLLVSDFISECNCSNLSQNNNEKNIISN